FALFGSRNCPVSKILIYQFACLVQPAIKEVTMWIKLVPHPFGPQLDISKRVPLRSHSRFSRNMALKCRSHLCRIPTSPRTSQSDKLVLVRDRVSRPSNHINYISRPHTADSEYRAILMLFSYWRKDSLIEDIPK